MLLIKVEQIINSMKTKKWEGFSGKGKYTCVKVDIFIVLNTLINFRIDRWKVKFFEETFVLDGCRANGRHLFVLLLYSI